MLSNVPELEGDCSTRQPSREHCELGRWAGRLGLEVVCFTFWVIRNTFFNRPPLKNKLTGNKTLTSLTNSLPWENLFWAAMFVDNRTELAPNLCCSFGFEGECLHPFCKIICGGEDILVPLPNFGYLIWVISQKKTTAAVSRTKDWLFDKMMNKREYRTWTILGRKCKKITCCGYTINDHMASFYNRNTGMYQRERKGSFLCILYKIYINKYINK